MFELIAVGAGDHRLQHSRIARIQVQLACNNSVLRGVIQAKDIQQRRIPAFRGEEISPGKDVQTDEQIDAHIRASAETAYHPSCTCAMGTGEMAVVDSQGRVHGVQGLRVCDASIMPLIVSGNLNVPTIMMAEKIADAIKGRALLPSNAPAWVHPNWETQQR